MIKEITPPEAWDILQSDHKASLLDVRSSMEFEYVGHSINALNIPWVEPPDWKIDPDFVEKVRESLQKLHNDEPLDELPVLAICRSGKRSLAAAEALVAAGFKQVFNVSEGFEGDRDTKDHRSTINGWRFHNLPWAQS